MTAEVPLVKTGALPLLFNGLALVGRGLGLERTCLSVDALEKRVWPNLGEGHLDDTSRALTASAIASVGEDSRLTPFGEYAVREIVLRTMRVQRALSEFKASHPEILARRVERPILIVGWYRTGTTLAHRLLASADRVRAPRAYELYFPVPEHEEPLEADRTRIKRTRAMLRLAHLAIPALRRLHRITPESAEESTVLLDNAGAGIYMLHAFGAHGHGERLMASDLHAAYAALKCQLQVLQGPAPSPDRWILKCPFSLAHLMAFHQVFPDGSVVHIHRDIVGALASVCRLALTLQSAFVERPDVRAIGRFWANFCLEAAAHAERARTLYPRGHYIDVDYDSLSREPIATALALGEKLALTIQPNALHAALTEAGAPSPPFARDLSVFGLDATDVVRRHADLTTTIGRREY
ncbi:MAG: hypothetical protein GC150_07665 [Rhizobiales bacterium]|nr:hypothetical protein [Hyphomicrobiales bacterium]